VSSNYTAKFNSNFQQRPQLTKTFEVNSDDRTLQIPTNTIKNRNIREGNFAGHFLGLSTRLTQNFRRIQLAAVKKR
jgi:hypothetical protein